MRNITKLLFGLVLVATSLGSDISNFDTEYSLDYESSEEIEERITGGIAMTETELEKFKYQVGFYSLNTDEEMSICGGALVHPKVILTAAHCVVDTKFLAVFMGTILKPKYMRTRGNIRVEAKDIVIHKEYNCNTYENDIAIIFLPNDAPSSPYVGTIEMASNKSTKNCQKNIAHTSGWGRVGDGDAFSETLNYLQVKPITYDECHESYENLVPDKQLCSSGIDSKGICKGDSGGPYVFDDDNGERYLCGLNSFIGSENCVNSKPKAYTSVAYYNDDGWICKNSRNFIPC